MRNVRCRVWDVPRRVPFTLLFMAAMSACTVAFLLLPGGLPAGVAEIGLSIDTLARGELWRIVTATVIAHDGVRLFEQLVFIAGMVGVFEALHGTGRTVAVFYGTDIFGKLMMLVLFLSPLGPLLQFGLPNQTAVFDVGMSGGGMALLAGSLHRLFCSHRLRVLIVGLCALVVKILVWPEPDSDVLHLITFPAGWALAEFARRNTLS